MAEQKQNRPRGGGPGRGMSAPVEKAKDFKGTIKNWFRILALIKSPFSL